jgi:hypothetical protein
VASADVLLDALQPGRQIPGMRFDGRGARDVSEGQGQGGLHCRGEPVIWKCRQLSFFVTAATSGKLPVALRQSRPTRWIYAKSLIALARKPKILQSKGEFDER